MMMQTFQFRHVRDYQVASTRGLESEYVFSFDDGAEKGRARGVFYAPVAGASTLRKRRPRVSRSRRQRRIEGTK